MERIDYTIGDEVVCIDAVFKRSNGEIDPCPLEENHVYKVKALFVDKAYYYRSSALTKDTVIVVIDGPQNAFRKKDGGWAALRFKKVQKKKTDIGVFEKLLNTKELENV